MNNNESSEIWLRAVNERGYAWAVSTVAKNYASSELDKAMNIVKSGRGHHKYHHQGNAENERNVAL